MSNGDRGRWGSRLGFILAASGSAVGLGNIWKFPFETGKNGGGWFVLIYLGAVLLIGIPVMIAEIMIGRRAQKSPAQAFADLSGVKAWSVVGWMGVVTGFVILSFYSVIAGWTLHYTYLAVTNAFSGAPTDEIQAMFGEVAGNWQLGLGWHAAFMLMTIGIVIGGVSKGLEKATRILMPTLFGLLIILLIYAVTQPAFGEALSFMFTPDASKLTAHGGLSAVGHAFFSLSLGMGALITYGSYLDRKADIVKSAVTISLLDTAVALMASFILFPIIFSHGLEANGGPGLVFTSMPLAFSEMALGYPLAIAFFLLLFFAALTSAISLLEVVVATVIDQLGWPRKKAALVIGFTIFAYGIPTVLSFSGHFTAKLFDRDFFTLMDYITGSWLLPLGGLFIAIFVGWYMPAADVRDEFTAGSTVGYLYDGWHFLIKFVVPLAIIIVFLLGVLPAEWLPF